MIVIIGAGPAGLSAAYHLNADFVILEQHAEPGGLCRSFELGGVTFDIGGHAFFTRHGYVRRLIQQTFAVPLFTQQRQAWVYSHGTYIRYPFQMHLHGLPDGVVKECLVGLYQAAADRSDAPPRNLQSWIDRSFGAGIARHFLTPYNRKLWAYPLDEISPDWTSDRIVLPDHERIIAGALEAIEFTDFANATVSYPAQGGYSGLFEGLLQPVKDRLRQAQVVSVDLHRRSVVTNTDEIVPYDCLISTMPLTHLIASVVDASECCRLAAASLRYNSLHLVNLVFDRPNISEMHRVYVADEAIPFHKLVLNSNSSATLRELPRFGIQAEVSFSSRKTVEVAGLEQWVLDSLVTMGLVEPREAPVADSMVTVEHAYPVRTPDTERARQHLLTDLAEAGVYCAGRFGEWLYINADDAIMRGLVQAQAVETELKGRQL
jgi:UDP-galactopyranose mutase